MTTADAYRIVERSPGDWIAMSAHPETDDTIGSTLSQLLKQLPPGRLSDEPVWQQHEDSFSLSDDKVLVHSSLSPDPVQTLTSMITHGGLWSLRDRDRLGLTPQGLSLDADRASGWDSFVCFTLLDKHEIITREVDFQVVLKPTIMQSRTLGFLPQDIGSSYSRYRNLVAASPHSPPLLPSSETKQQWIERSKYGNEWIVPWHVPTTMWAAIHCHPHFYATYISLCIALDVQVQVVDWLY